MPRSSPPRQAARKSGSPTYRTPALEKGLDILECLGAERVPVTQARLARLLGRSQSEIFRMLMCLLQRGYVHKDPLSGAYTLTLRLFELGHTYSPYYQLTEAAARPMRELADEVRESCHLAVLDKAELLILSRAETPAPMGFAVQVGARFPPLGTASGRLLMAYLSEAQLLELWEREPDLRALTPSRRRAVLAHLHRIRQLGYEAARSWSIVGICDVSALVGWPGSRVRAALTIPALARDAQATKARLLQPLLATARRISDEAGLLELPAAKREGHEGSTTKSTKNTKKEEHEEQFS